MRCPHCGQQNPDQYLYCATCGVPLTAASAETTATRPVAPGAARQMHVEKRDVSYLLEDDAPRKSPLGKILVVLVLAVVGVFAWRQLRPAPAGTNPVAEVSPGSASPGDQAVDQPPSGQQTAGEKPTEPPATTEPVQSGSQAAASTPQADATSAPPAKIEPQPQPEVSGPTEKPESTETSTESSDAHESATKEEVAPPRPEPIRPVAKPSPKPKPSPADPVKQAEAYLYGRGVAKDCDRAVTLLKSAADKSNVRARSTLGSMYATGHCVARDLPTAYRYFALVLRTDPENATASQNLESIWKQMTPPERQAATK